MEKLLKKGARAVHDLSLAVFFAQSLAQTCAIARLRCSFASPFACARRRHHYNHRRAGDWRRAQVSSVNSVTFNETIHGRSYVIVALPVGPDRWRAEVARTPGATTALMPFYGATPAEAARQLAGWLLRAGQRQKP